MKKLQLFTLLLLGFSLSGFAKDGYKIKLELKNTKDSMVYLVHYYGKPLPTIYKIDSASIDNKGRAIFDNKDSVLGGIYMMLLSDRATYFEFLLKNGDDMEITADMKKLPYSVEYKNSPENIRFYEYVKFLKGFGEEQEKFMKELETAKTAEDTTAIREKASAAGAQLKDYRRNYAAKYPNTLLSNIFKALETPVVPEGKHYLPDGQEDTLFSYHYYKDHYWDQFNFNDDRLIHTPIYDAKLDEYFNKIVAPMEDSVIKESDIILSKIPAKTELFKYTLFWLARNAEKSDIMGMDKVFVYLVENYFMRGAAFWMERDQLEKYYRAAALKSPNLIGKIAPELEMKDVEGKTHKLSEFKAKYTLLVFWEPTCGHCMKEIPLIDSVYKAELKAKGVRIIGVKTDDPVQTWQQFIKENDLNEWTHLYDPDRTSNFRGKYDVVTTPSLFLLDENKIIIGKRLDHSNISTAIEITEKKREQALNNQ